MTEQPKSPRQVSVKTLAIWGLVVVLIVVWLVWWQSDALLQRVCRPLLAEAEQRAAALEATRPAPGGEAPERAAEAVAEVERLAELERRWTALRGGEPVWPDDLSSPEDCDAVHQEMLALCREVDALPEIRDRLSSGSICGLVRQAAEQLAAHPPELSSELRSYAAILANVFHLSRTLGRKQVELLRDAMAADAVLDEPGAMILYRWVVSREKCAQGTAIRPERLYEYAGFLLHTVGGQAYLRRRSPEVEGLASFYALMILDRAIEEGFNPQGYDPRPEISRCRKLLESQPLVFRDRYVALLDDMNRRWEAKGATGGATR